MSLHVDEYLATGDVPGPRHSLLTGRYACYDVYPCADGEWLAVGAIEPQFFANLCRALGCEQWIEHQTDDAVQDEIRADFRAAFATKARDDVGRGARPGRTPASPRSRRSPSWSHDEHLRDRARLRRPRREPTDPTSSRSAGRWPAWTAPSPGPSVRDARRSPTPTRSCATRASTTDEIAALREEGAVA